MLRSARGWDDGWGGGIVTDTGRGGVRHRLLLSGQNTPSGEGGGYRDGWVGWPQISAFWATRHPPPRVRFSGVSGLCRALRSA